MKPNRLISVLVVFTTLITCSAGQNISCNTRRAFTARNGTALKITNKYGDLNIITTKDDSLTICAIITINQENQVLVQKSMKMITINIEKLKDTIFVSTLYDKKFFSEELRAGRKSFSTDYLIRLPEYINVRIRDEFGNISVDELSGSVDIRLSQGSLNAKKLNRGNVKPVNSVYADHAKVTIDDSNWMTMTLVNCPSVELGKAQALNLNSTISKISIGELSSLVSVSKSDNLRINSVNNIVSEGTYSTYEIGNVKGQLKSTLRYGTIKISDVNKNFSGIDITSDHSQVFVNPASGVSFKAEISSTDGAVVISTGTFPGIVKTSGQSSISYTGLAGNDKNTKSVIRINATGGKVALE